MPRPVFVPAGGRSPDAVCIDPMRVLFVAIGAVALVVCGALQVIASVALREQAASVGWMRAASGPLTRGVDRLEPGPILPQELRRVLGERALARGDTARADRFAHALAPGPDREALFGAIAQARGDDRAAVADYLAAGDLAHLETRVDARVHADDVPGALDLQNDVLAHLRATGAQRDTIADATYRLGIVLQDRAYGFPPNDPQRRVWALRSRDAYVRAWRLAPLETRYLIALGNQSLNIADFATARRVFARAHDIDPASVEPLTGLADTALRAHDPIAARAYLAAARAVAPDSPAVAELARRIGP